MQDFIALVFLILGFFAFSLADDEISVNIIGESINTDAIGKGCLYLILGIVSWSIMFLLVVGFQHEFALRDGFLIENEMFFNNKESKKTSVYGKNYYDFFLVKERANSQRNKLRKYELISYKDSGKMLELGCGLAEFSKLCIDIYDVVCVDTSDYIADKLEGSKDLQFIKNDVETFDFSEMHADIVVAYNLLEHIHYPRALLERIIECLNPEGVLIGSVPNNY